MIITLKSLNGPENCIIDPNGTEAENHRAIYLDDIAEGGSIIEGFTIQNGYHVNGAAILLEYISLEEIYIDNCVFKDNMSNSLYGSVIDVSNTDIQINNCDFLENKSTDITAGGGKIIIYGCSFIDNCGDFTFLGVFLEEDSVIKNCSFIRNGYTEGSSIILTEFCVEGDLVIANCEFIDNSNTCIGRGSFCTNNLYIVNCLFNSNKGSAVKGDSKTNVINSTIVSNVSSDGYAGIDGGNCYNSILWGNFGAPIRTGYLIRNCCIEGFPTDAYGVNNISIDPDFIDADGPDDIPGNKDDDFRLSPYSPCIDAGDNQLLPQDFMDLDQDEDVNEPLLDVENNLIAHFDYDENGNRDMLTYSLNAKESLNKSVSIDYNYNLDNLLTGYNTTSTGVTGPTFTLSDVDVDGLGRLVSAGETITKVDNAGTISYLLNNFTNPDDYPYDMRSQLIKARIERTTEPASIWEATYNYRKDGNIDTRVTSDTSETTFDYDFQAEDDGDIMTGATGGEEFTLSWDENGRQTSQLNAVPANFMLVYDWEGRLREGWAGGENWKMQAKYTSEGVRIERKKIWDGATVYNHKYIVDTIGKVPTVLLVLDADNNDILKTYIHANNQVISQHDGDYTEDKFFYLHDRLGSIRQMINAAGQVVNCYTYDPWGMPAGDETVESMSNMYRFAGYIWDDEVSQYYCYRRQYDPVLGRFTSRDPVECDFKEPTTLHAYLYCLNDPINRTDPSGELWGALRMAYRVVRGIEAYYTMLDVGLQAARSPWDIMEVAITANAWREAYFDPENLNKPYAWELALQRGLGGVIDKISDECDWGPLVGCVVKDYAKGLLKEAPLVVIGEVSCYLCYGDPELISKTGFCIGCGLYRYSNPARIAVNIVTVADCVSKHCNW